MAQDNDRDPKSSAPYARSADEYRMQILAKMAAEEAIFATFRLLGVDVKEQDSVNSLRADLFYLSELRKNAVDVQYERRKSFYQNIGALVVSAILALAGYYLGRIHGGLL